MDLYDIEILSGILAYILGIIVKIKLKKKINNKKQGSGGLNDSSLLPSLFLLS